MNPLDPQAQADTDGRIDAALRYEGRHPDQIEGRERQRRTVADVELGALRVRAFEEATRRGHSFDVPLVPGAGWASALVREQLRNVFGYARELFVELFDAEERTRATKRLLAGDDRAGFTKDVGGLSDLATERNRLDTLEARFERALEQLAAWRSNIAQPEYIEQLERANEIERPFESYIVDDMPERNEIRAAITAFVAAVESVRARYEGALAKSSAAVRAAHRLGIPLRELPDTSRVLTLMAGQSLVRDVVVEALRGASFVLSDYMPSGKGDGAFVMPFAELPRPRVT